MYDQDDMYGESRQRNPMATASVALGIASLLTCSIFYIAFPCGALAIICAILSRGKFRLTGKSRAGIICGAIGITLSAVITVAAVHTVLTSPQMKERLEQTLQLYLGDSSFDLDEMLDSMVPSLNLFGSGDEDTAPAADETESETEKRVRLRVAGEEETEASEPASENTAETGSEPDQQNTTETDTEPARQDTTENGAEPDQEDYPLTTPEGGGAFI